MCGYEDPFGIKVPKEVDDDGYERRVITIWEDGLISIKNIDRIALRAIKSGDWTLFCLPKKLENGTERKYLAELQKQTE